MGRPKLLLPWAGTTILGHIVRQWKLLKAAQIIPVFRANDAELEAEWARLGNNLDSRIINEQPGAGMFSSVQAASRWEGWKNEISHFVVTLGDQPQISGGVLRSLVQFASESAATIVQPQINGRPKHPVIFPRASFYALSSSTASTLREFLEDHRANRRFWVCDEPSLEVDLDTAEDYANARQRFDSDSMRLA